LDKSREERLIEHMAAMLKTHASVGRIIAEAPHEGQLLHGVCQALVANRGYNSAWIVLFDQERMATRWAQSGLDDDFAALVERFQQCRFTRCVIEALNTPLPLIYADPFSECGDCPLAGKYEGFSAISIRLHAGGDFFGVLTVAIPKNLIMEAQERDLFADLGESISQGIRRLRQSETLSRQTARLLQYERIISRVDDLMSIVDRQYRYIVVNDAYEREFGKPRHEIEGRTVADLLGEEYFLVQVQPRLDEAFAGREICYEHLFQGDDNEAIHRRLQYQPVRDHNGEVTEVVITAHDITDRKHAEEELRRTNILLQSIIDVMPGSLSVMDTEYRVLNANRFKAQSIFGEKTNSMEVFGQKCFKLFQNRDIPCPWCKMEEVLSIGNSVLEVTRPDDPREIVTGRAFQVYLNPIKDEDGNILGVVEYGLDITELRRAKELALAANQAKSEFLANMSHELRTPLNGIMGMLQLLGLTGLNAEQEDYALTGLQSCERLIRLLTDILDLSRIESGKMSIQSEPLELRQLLDQIKALFTPAIRQDGISFELEIDPDIPLQLLGDPARLQQILTNMVGNALKFTHGGNVSLQTSLLPKTREGQCTVLFSIADTGIGIPDDKLGTLFRPFSQVSQGYTRSYQGAGLGLSICKRLVELMGGSISVESEEGVGTTMHFTTTFGIAPPPDQDAFQVRPSQRRVREGLKILVVEDDHVSSITVAMILRKFMTEPTRVEDGRQAIAALGRETFDLVLMDVQMPVMDGVETTQAIRAGAAGEEMKSVPIIALTAYAMNGDRERFLRAGMDDYLAKPVSMADLERILLKYSQIEKAQP